MDSYEPEDSYYDEVIDLAAYMDERGNVDSIHNVLQYSCALCDGKPKPKEKLRQAHKPNWPELQIKGTVWTNISPELRSAWARKDDKNKEQVIAQFKEPITKNCQLTAYKANWSYGYDSDFTANTQNSEGTFVFGALQAET